MSNIFKTTLLLTGMTLLLMLAGRAFGGQNGMLMALVFAAVMNFVSYFFSDKIALATYRAQPVSREDCRASTISSSAWHKRSACRCPEGLPHPDRLAQRLRHRTQSEPRLSRRNPGHPRTAQRRRTGRRAGP